MIKVALAGNPNCGKTTLFNDLTGSKQHVGNWPGVTVDKKEGTCKKNKEIKILDLPGTYSLSPYSAEEIVAGETITGKNGENIDVVLNIVDGTSIERNLYLTLQIMETQVPMVIALNMMDEVEAAGTKIDVDKLSEELGVKIVPMVARSGKGLDEVVKAIESVAASKATPKNLAIFEEIKKVEAEAKTDEEKEEAEITVADLRYKVIDSIVSATVKKGKAVASAKETKSDKIDKVLTNRFLGIPIFLVIMYAMYACTFSENFLWLGINSPGMWLAGVVEGAWEWVVELIAGLIEGASPWVYALVVDGILAGIGAVLGFMPLVLVLYLLMSFLEDSGYMARVAFILDRLFRKFGLSGRSFIPLLMGIGCGVPAIMATRTLEKEKDRKITAIITAFMPCGAKLPIFAMFFSTMFADDNQTILNYSIYLVSIVVAIIVSLLLNKLVYKSEASNFIMELPQYRVPTAKSVLFHGWEKVKGFGKKAGTVILLSTILIWFLSSFNVDSFNGKNKEANEDGTIMCEMNDSFLASAGKTIAPIFKPLGFGEWRPTVGVVTGWIAKENVVVTFAQLYEEDVTQEYLDEFFGAMEADELEELGFEGGEYDPETAFDIYAEGILFEGADENAMPTMKDDIKTKQAAYAYMVFNLLCMPCFAAVGALKRELKTWKATGTAVGIQMLTAYIVALLVNVIGGLF